MEDMICDPDECREEFIMNSGSQKRMRNNRGHVQSRRIIITASVAIIISVCGQ